MTSPGRSGDSDNGVVEIHRAIVAGKLEYDQRQRCGERDSSRRLDHSKRGAKKLSVADELLKANERFVKNFNLGNLAVRPRRRVAVLACMDYQDFV